MKKIVFSLLFSISLFASSKPTLLFYCGITMVTPMKEISKIIEKKHNCKIKIIQGGSKDLYKALSYSKKGDIYLPGSNSYRLNNLKDGYLLDAQDIGYNQAAIFVQKGNPKNIKSIDSLIDPNIKTIICDYTTGSIGKNTKKILVKYKNERFFEEVFDNAIIIGTDSRNINQALRKKDVDMAINWKATAFYDINKDKIDIIDIDEKYSPKKRLVLNLLSFSKYPDIVRDFMKVASSPDGINIMKKYGFR